MDLAALHLNYWILQSIAMGFTALFIPKLRITSIFGATVMVVGLALVNAHLWSAALFFQIPDSLTAQSALLFAANGTIFWLLVKLLPGIEVEGFLPALIAPVIFTITSVLIDHYASHVDFIALAKQARDLTLQARDYFLQSGDATASVPKK